MYIKGDNLEVNTQRISLILFFSIFYLTGCSTVNSFLGIDRTKDFRGSLEVMSDRDFLDQIDHFSELFRSSGEFEVINLEGRGFEYLNSVYQNLVMNNEILITSPQRPRFFIVSSKIPFHFSVPRGDYFFSTGLIDKYLRNEDLFVAMFATEVIKSNLGVFQKREMVPVGYIGLEKILQYLRVPLEVKNELNKWAYDVIRRGGYDQAALLNWLQLQNKNSLDFSLQVGDVRQISREEFAFKNFIVTELRDGIIRGGSINASTEFYYFMDIVRRNL